MSSKTYTQTEVDQMLKDKDAEVDKIIKDKDAEIERLQNEARVAGSARNRLEAANDDALKYAAQQTWVNQWNAERGVGIYRSCGFEPRNGPFF